MLRVVFDPFALALSAILAAWLEPSSQPAGTRGYVGQSAVAEGGDQASSQGEHAQDDPKSTAALVVDMPPHPEDVEGTMPVHKWVYSNLLGARINPIGLGDELFIGYRRQLLRRPGLLYRDSFLALKLHVFATPAFLHTGPRLEIQPLSVIGVSATCDFLGYFGSFGQVMGFPGPWSNYSDSHRRTLARAGGNRAMAGVNVRISTLLQGRIGPVGARSQLHFNYAALPLDDGDRVFYEPAADALQPNRGWLLVSDLDVFYFFKHDWTLVLRYTATKGFYRSQHVPPEDTRDRSVDATHRLGPAVLYTFFDRPRSRFNRPTLILLTQWWIHHPWRTGADTHPAIPYAALALTFEGDLLPRSRKRGGADPRRRRMR